MMRRLIIVTAVIGIPLAIWFASQYGQPAVLTFQEAIAKATSSSESEQSPKVLIEVQVISVESDHDLVCADATGAEFRVEYTGSAPSQAFATGQRHRLLGHVHDGAAPYFHATQRFDS